MRDAGKGGKVPAASATRGHAKALKREEEVERAPLRFRFLASLFFPPLLRDLRPPIEF